ncbi:hypothetical protein [Sphingomonas sp. SAFR-052]|uniref:hypothetical protein n=1 Tax=Sphingomonas sp. SAFR-052 TaxID=3436867 RepID=UPI003F81CE8C
MRNMPGTDEVPPSKRPTDDKEPPSLHHASSMSRIDGASSTGVGVVLDVTLVADELGRNSVADLSVRRFRYDERYEILGSEHARRWVLTPGLPLSISVGALYGNRDSEIACKYPKLTDAGAIVRSGSFCVARCAAHVRPVVEQLLPEARTRPWVCSIEDLRSVASLPGRSTDAAACSTVGIYEYVGDRCSDVDAVIATLGRRLSDDTSLLAAMLRNAQRKEWIVRVSRERPGVRHCLHARGYSWDPVRSAWWRSVADRCTEEQWMNDIPEFIGPFRPAVEFQYVDWSNRYASR